MKNHDIADSVFTACASCTVIAVGAALAVVLYEIVTVSVTLVESSMFAGSVWLRGF